jgi:hypothetical protein
MDWRNKINCTTKNLECKKNLRTKKVDNETEYKSRRAIAKRDIRKYIANPGNTISHSDIYKIKPNIFKLLKHINKYIIELASINPVPSK